MTVQSSEWRVRGVLESWGFSLRLERWLIYGQKWIWVANLDPDSIPELVSTLEAAVQEPTIYQPALWEVDIA